MCPPALPVMVKSLSRRSRQGQTATPVGLQIFIREKKVKVKRMTSLLRDKIQETYRPQSNPEFRCDIEMGFNTENENLYGMMLYHRNRLIRPYHRSATCLIPSSPLPPICEPSNIHPYLPTPLPALASLPPGHKVLCVASLQANCHQAATAMLKCTDCSIGG